MHDMTHEEYWTEVRSLAKQIHEEAQERGEDPNDVLHETIDGHEWVIYTGYNSQVLHYSPNHAYAIEELGVVASRDNPMWEAQLAYGALYADVAEALGDLPDEDEV